MNQQLILVINCGSSSLKFSLICLSTKHTILTGLAECLGTPEAQLTIKKNGEKTKTGLVAPHNHRKAIENILTYLKEQQLDQSIIALGHRFVHGGEVYSAPTLINDQVIEKIEELSSLAPLHNPANLIGVDATQAAFPKLPQVAVFDTAFHQTMPEQAFLYAIPYELYTKHGIRRYGFHGTSHYFVAKEAAKILDKKFSAVNLITAHLGNGCSISAIKDGRSVDTSMGLTPLEGVAMGTRSGDIDPGLLLHLQQELGYTAEQLNQLLNKDSGLKGLSSLSNDCRALEDAVLKDNHPQATIALSVFCYRIAKTISSYIAALESLDGLVFTGGIGENSSFVRTQVVKRLSLLNIHLDEEKNEATRFGASGNIASPTSRPCLVIPTNEEWVIAEQTQQVLNKE
ncbi:acetate kinase [Thalassotalea atypica]|uniref:acetate kinase n=1 Tax=Thalassotalea atypica TaxID=2054316 RepID=UPI002573CC92|nr:acetate kinase [Thalassotalea atypica]